MKIEDLYAYLSDFLKESLYSNRKFALIIGINPRTFQNMISNKSKMRFDAFIKIIRGMNEILDLNSHNSVQRAVLTDLITKFFECYGEMYPDEISFNCHEYGELGAKLSVDGTYTLHTVVTSGKNKGRPVTFFYTDNQQVNTRHLLSAFEDLNEIGQDIGIKCIKELTKIPEYVVDLYSEEEISQLVAYRKNEGEQVAVERLTERLAERLKELIWIPAYQKKEE